MDSVRDLCPVLMRRRRRKVVGGKIEDRIEGRLVDEVFGLVGCAGRSVWRVGLILRMGSSRKESFNFNCKTSKGNIYHH